MAYAFWPYAYQYQPVLAAANAVATDAATVVRNCDFPSGVEVDVLLNLCDIPAR